LVILLLTIIKGLAYLYYNNGTQFNLNLTITPTGLTTYDNFGTSVSILNQTIIIGASGATGSIANTGTAYVYGTFVLSSSSVHSSHKTHSSTHSSKSNAVVLVPSFYALFAILVLLLL